MHDFDNYETRDNTCLKFFLLFILFNLLVFIFTTTDFFHNWKDGRVLENIETYERLAVQLSKVEEERSGRQFKSDRELNQLKTLFSEYEIYEDISRLHQNDLLNYYYFESSKEITFGTKSYEVWYWTEYSHSLYYRADNKLPTFNIPKNYPNPLMKLERIKENWFYVIRRSFSEL